MENEKNNGQQAQNGVHAMYGYGQQTAYVSAQFQASNSYLRDAVGIPRGKEIIVAIGSYVASWFYVLYWENTSWNALYLLIFAALFTAGGLFLLQGRKAGREQWIWLVCLWVILVTYIVGHDRVFGDYYPLLLHAFAIYWILSRAGCLTEGRSGAYLPVDAIYGTFLLTFPKVFSLFRPRLVIRYAGMHTRQKEVNERHVGSAAAAIAAAVVLLAVAIHFLTSADDRFADLMASFSVPFSFENMSENILRLLLSLPVGAFLTALLCGAGRERPEALAQRKNRTETFLDSLRKVGPLVWTILLGVFAVVYLVFLGLQASYLFSAFAGRLPENFTVAEYARQGFFDLCRVMALTDGLLWLALRSSRQKTGPVRTAFVENRPLRLMSTLLLLLTVLFAVTALSKLCLYIGCFGFTPRRLQSFWLAVVLACGSLCALVSIWTGKKTTGFWIYFTGISLAALHLY